MDVKRHGLIFAGAFAVILACAQPVPLRGAERPLELKWDQLVPAAPPKAPKPFFAGRPADPAQPGNPHDTGTAPGTPQLPEGRWMSVPSKANILAPVVEGLDGKRVQIGGYVVPLDFEATRVKEFLLVPFVGACIHVPPPPANQIIYVKTEQGFDVQGTFDPVWVTGTMKVTQTYTGLADAGYSIEAEKVEPRSGG